MSTEPDDGPAYKGLTLGQLACVVHEQIGLEAWKQLDLKVEGASERVYLVCPVSGCGYCIRIVCKTWSVGQATAGKKRPNPE